MAETARRRIVNDPPPLPTQTAAPAPVQATTGRKRIVNEPPPLPSQAATVAAPTTASIAPLETSLPPLPRPTVADVAPPIEHAPTAEPASTPADMTATAAYEPQPQDAYELSGANVRDWQGHIAAGTYDAVVTSIPATIQLGQGILANWTRDVESYPEEVSRESGFSKEGIDGALQRFAYNSTHRADDTERWSEKARRASYNLGTAIGEQAANSAISPVSLATRAVQTAGGEGGGWQTFERDPEAEYGERGYVAPSKEILPDIATAAVPIPGSKFKALSYAADMLTEAPVLLDKGLKLADNLLEWFTPFAVPGTTKNMVTNAATTGAVDEGLRDLSGQETMTAPVVETYHRVKDGVTSSGISGYDDAWAEPSNEGYVK